MAPHKRRIKLIQPRFQLRLIAVFSGLALLGLVLQFILFAATISALAADLPQDGPMLIESIPPYTLAVFGISLCVLLPMTISVGILVTFRIAGPLYRFEQHLKAIARGEDPGECRIRKGDELQGLCGTINEAVSALRREARKTGMRGAQPAERDVEKAA